MPLDASEIDALVKKFDDEAKALRKNLLHMCWYMRGGLTYDQSFLLTPEERTLIGDIIEENLNTTKESGLPFF